MSASFLGVFLVDEGFITASQLEEALALQRAYQEMRIGEVLVQMGMLKRDRLAEELRTFARLDGQPEGDGANVTAAGAPARPRRFGEYLVDRQVLSRLEVERGLARQQRYRTRRLGELLVALGYLTRDELAEAIRIQFQRVATA